MLSRNARFTLRALLLVIPLCAQEKYDVTIDLQNVTREKDRVKVTIITPPVKDDKIVYRLPAVIPGSYSRKDYGRFVHEFVAYDVFGIPLKAKKSDVNTIVIRNPKKATLQKIEYWVDDTWDDQKASEKISDEKFNYIFQPGGTNIEADKNFVLNWQGFFGYLEGKDTLPYQVTIWKPGPFFGSTTAAISHESSVRDVVKAPSFAALVDHPLMYCFPDTTSFTVNGSRIAISVYSENKLVNAEQLRRMLIPLGNALGNFFDSLPVSHYKFIFYFAGAGPSPLTRYGGYGALEHNYCSFYFLPEIASDNELKTLLFRVTAHEFLHILTPLNIHSREVDSFSFDHPKMSKHLWLYEGVTEYFAQLVQVRDSLKTEAEFRETMRSKIQKAATYPEVSFTAMSQNILEKPYRSMYPNVYEKGALIAFLLDIRLMELSDGTMSLRDLLRRLALKYGPDRPFEDELLFDEIAAMSFPEIRTFFRDYVEGAKPLPYGEYFKKIGWNYYPTRLDSATSFGKINLYFDEKEDALVVTRTAANNRFQLQNGDKLVSINGNLITYKNFERLLMPVFRPAAGETVTLTYRRSDLEKTVTASPGTMPVYSKYVIDDNPDASSSARRLRRKLLTN